MADDKRCGTCRHWTRSETPGAMYGRCKIIGHWDKKHATYYSEGTDCPGWVSQHALDRLYAAVAEMPDFIRDKMVAACRRSGGVCFCGSHVSEVQE